VHPNPAVQQVAQNALNSVDRALLIDPLDYPTFAKAMSQAALILSDSGGIQEEAPSLGIPLLVLRESSARGAHPIESNTHIVGTHPNEILEAALAMLDRAPVTAVEKLTNPYSDDSASARIVTAIKRIFLNSLS
jgi:UDP-N-acetylglucosamine 2-epimerase (non-hydrolysing)